MTCCRTPGAGKLLWTMPTPDQKQHHIHDNFQYEWCPPILITEGLQIPGWHHGAEPPGRRRHRGIGLIHVVQHKLHCLTKSVLFQHWSTSCVKYLQLVKLLWNSKSEHVQKPHFTTNLKGHLNSQQCHPNLWIWDLGQSDLLPYVEPCDRGPHPAPRSFYDIISWCLWCVKEFIPSKDGIDIMKPAIKVH